MRREIAGKKKKLITASVVGVVTAAIIGTALYNDSTVSMARPSLPGVENIVKANGRNKPFNILEIVPDFSSARMGYMIEGEEPGDYNTAKSINDMASEEERRTYYMTDGHAPIYTDAYINLKDVAFEYTEYSENSSIINEDTENVRVGATYGTFVSSTEPGLYVESNASSVYGFLGDESGLSIDDIVNKNERTKGDGLFYMDYVEYTQTPNGGYTIDLIKLTSSDSWKQPFKSYYKDGEPFFNDKLYVIDKSFFYKLYDNETEDTEEDDQYILDTENYSDVVAGDAIFQIPANSNSMNFYGSIVDVEGQLKFFNGTDYIDITGQVGEVSLAGIIADANQYDNPSFVTIRKESELDATADKYYIVETREDSNGMFSLNTYDKLAVNDVNYSVDVFGIVDEYSTYGEWYHKWYFKLANADPYIYVGDNGEQAGNFDFVYNPSSDLFYKNYYYLNGYTNYELFKKNVLDVDDERLSSVFVDVKTKELQNVTEADITNADLVYFTGLKQGVVYSQYKGDMNEDAAKALLKAIDDDYNKPVIINTSCYFEDALVVAEHTNIYTVFSVMMSEDVSNAGSLVVLNDDDNTKTEIRISDTLKDEFQVNAEAYTARLADKLDSSHVTGSVFVNDDEVANDVIYSDFTDAFSQAKINGFTLGENGPTFGFSAVVDEIEYEAFYQSITTSQLETENFVQDVSKATVIRYILNYGNRRIIGKTELKVLDIEPYYNREIESSKNYDALKYTYEGDTQIEVKNYQTLARDIFDVDWFCTNVSDSTRPESISVIGMGTKEFIGKIEDLSESYDMIYIGLDTAYMITEVDSDGNKTDKVLSNDKGQLIYKRTGDSITTTGMDGGDGTFAMSGNDITPDKLRELKEFVSAGYAVMLSDKFFNYYEAGAQDDDGKDIEGRISGINTLLVDQDSYMYQFVKWCQDENKLGYNVGVKTDYDKAVTDASVKTTTGATRAANCVTFVNYLNISKLEVEVLRQPALYNTYDNRTEHNYLTMNSDGVYTLDFEVKLTNNAATGITDNTYDCQLYIDIDGDGRFEPIEKLQNDTMIIQNMDNDTRMEVTEGRFHLSTGSKYSITRRVPDGYVGLISWKLVFAENGKTMTRTVINEEGEEEEQVVDIIRVAVQDYSAISDRLNKPTIKILQLTSGNSTDTHLNLKTDTTLQNYYKQVIDFELNENTITVCPIDDLIDGTGIFENVDKLDKLIEYDMLVLGFTDMYRVKVGTDTEEAIFAIRQYMLSGRSVLFTHDLTSTYTDASDSWGYYANIYLRDIQGMDRYGLVQSNVVDKKYKNIDLLNYVSVYDSSSTLEDDRRGFADSTLLRYNGSTYGEVAAYGTRRTGYDNKERELTSVARVNRGQITEYPFRIGSLEQNADNSYTAKEVIEVATTHHQYLQLNLETDYTDSNYDDDIVVWYAISSDADADGNYHKLNYNDVRNNYYIFSKGNIMYTGAGHSQITDNATSDNAEKKLFVNTLVAAYNAGVHPPFVSYRANDTELAASISSMYVPYDLSLAGIMQDASSRLDKNKENDEEGNSNENESSGWTDESNDKITVYFATNNNDLKDSMLPLTAEYYVGVDSVTDADITIGDKYYKIVKPVSVYDCSEKKDVAVTESTNKYDTLSSGKVYKLEFLVSDLMAGSSIRVRHSAVLYTRLSTKTKIEDMGKNATILPVSDSLKGLNVNFVELYDLK